MDPKDLATTAKGEPICEFSTMKSGDGWMTCAAGHQHWGLYGAAGLLISDGLRVVLQHRAPWTHQGGTWGVPGGAKDADESAVEAALREAGEEAGIAAADIIPTGIYVDDHGGWTYTTVVATAAESLRPEAMNAESVSVEWVQHSAVNDLALHSGFAGAWPRLQRPPARLRLRVPEQLAGDATLRSLVRHGIDRHRLPSHIDSGDLNRLIPAVVFSQQPSVGEGSDQLLTVSDFSELIALL